MNRIGFYTWKIYRNGEMPQVGECCVVVSDEALEDEEFIEQLRMKKRIKCIACFGCPASIQSKGEQQ